VERIVDLSVSSLVAAGFYAAMAYGLGLIYGVLRVVNLTHGGVIMAAAYFTWVLHTSLNLDPYLSIPIVLATFFAFGVGLYLVFVRFLPRGAAGGVQSLLLLFGLWLVMRNVAYLVFGGNTRSIQTSYSTASIDVLGTPIPVTRIILFLIAVAALIGLHTMLTRTYIGRAIRAVAQNPDSCTLVGINVERIYMLTFGLGTALAGLGGLFVATIVGFTPETGAAELLKSFVVVVLGGLGSVVGIAIGALVLAVAENFSILFMPFELTAAVGFVLLVLVLVLRPGGLFGQRVLA
jgi:branched-chain amino acid transport system permease protein